MADAGFLTSPRQQRSVYLHSRIAQTSEMPDYVYNSESNEDASADFAGIIQSTLNAYIAEDFWTTGGKVLLYNPITDSYDIKQGEYVL